MFWSTFSWVFGVCFGVVAAILALVGGCVLLLLPIVWYLSREDSGCKGCQAGGPK